VAKETLRRGGRDNERKMPGPLVHWRGEEKRGLRDKYLKKRQRCHDPARMNSSGKLGGEKKCTSKKLRKRQYTEMGRECIWS